MSEPATPRPPTSAERDCFARLEGGLGWLARRLERWQQHPEHTANELAATKATVAGLLRDVRTVTGIRP